MGKPIVFVITPFNEHFLRLYDHLKEQFKDNYEFTNAGDLDNQQNILKDIVTGIYNADVIIADLTGLNANVFYELGLAHAMDKKVIIITQDISDLPFDIKSYRANEYSLSFFEMPKLIEKLQELLYSAVNNIKVFGNPVSDYAPTSNAEKHTPTTQETTVHSPEDSADNFITAVDITPCIFDNIADAEEAINGITDITNQIASEMRDMNENVASATAEIERVKSTGGSSINTFIRNQARKVSVTINAFSNKFQIYNSQLSEKWSIMENNLLIYFDNAPALKAEDIDSFSTSLDEMYFVLDDNRTSMDDFLQSIKSIKGFERRLNASATSLETNTSTYLNIIDQMKASIDRLGTIMDKLKQNDE